MININSIILFILLFPCLVTAQEKHRFTQPVPLSSAINTEAEESTPVLSPDGKTLYFSRIFYEGNAGGKYAGADVWMSQMNENGEWQEAVNLGKPINNQKNNYVIGVSNDGQRLYLVNAYSSIKNNAIAVSKRFMNEWEDPQPIPVELPHHVGPVGFFMHPSEKILLISMDTEDGFGKEDIYICLKDSSGNWSKPENLGSTVNTAGFEISPFLDQQGKRLYFASNGHKSFGSSDIFKADRIYNSWNVWGKLENLGIPINTEGFDAYFIENQNDFYFVNNNGDKPYADILKSTVAVGTDSSQIHVQKLLDEAKKLLNSKE